MNISKLEKEILKLIRISKLIYSNGFIEGSGGNISHRFNKNKILIKKSGSKMGYLTPKDIIITDIHEEYPYHVSSDYFIHRYIYLNTGYKYVIHAHPQSLVTLSLYENEIVPITYDSKIILEDKLSVIESESHSDLIKVIDRESLLRGIIIEKGHGVYIARNRLDEAVNIIEVLEHLSSILLSR